MDKAHLDFISIIVLFILKLTWLPFKKVSLLSISFVLVLFRNVKGKILRFFCGALSVTISVHLVLIPGCIYCFRQNFKTISHIAFFKIRRELFSPGIILMSSFYILSFWQCMKNKIFPMYIKEIAHNRFTDKNNSVKAFLLYNRSEYYDRYYIDSFKQFMVFSGIIKSQHKSYRI
jgi:hypothetical protein